MIRILHISDLHIGKGLILPDTEYENLRRELLQRVKAAFEASGPDTAVFLVVTGDVVDDGIAAQYRDAREALGIFGGRILACPGNHDYGLQGASFQEKTVPRFLKLSSSISTQVKPVEEHGEYKAEHGVYYCLLDDHGGTKALLIGLDTCNRAAINLAAGEFTKAQENLVKSIVKDPVFEGIPKLLYLHHDPSWDESQMLPFMLLRRGKRVLALKGIDVILHGHSGDELLPKGISGEKRAKAVRLLETKRRVRVEQIMRPDGSKGAVRVDANACVLKKQWIEITIHDGQVDHPQIVPSK